MISVVLPSRNEPMVYDTARWMLEAGADEIVVVDDYSNPAVVIPDDLQGKVALITNRQPMGPAYCRNTGGKAAKGDKGDVIVYSDAHVKPSPGGITRLAELARELNTVVGAGCKPMEPTREWTGYGGVIVEMGDGGIDVKYNREIARHDKVTGYIGSVYAATRACWEEIGWWPWTLSWGYNEQALSLAVLYAGKQPYCATDVVCLHQFKKKFNYPMAQDVSRVNRFAVHYQVGAQPERWLLRLRRHFPREAQLWEREFFQHRAIWEERRAVFQARRKRTDSEVNDLICAWDAASAPFSANRLRDAGGERPYREHGTVCLFTAFAPGRERCLEKWIRHVEASGYPIDGRIFVLDNPRPDVELYARSSGAVVFTRPALASREDAVATANHLAGHWNLVLPELLKYDYILSVEDDVYPEPGFLIRLLNLQRSQRSIGATGAMVKARKDGHPMAYQLKTLDPWDINTSVVSPTTGKHSVGSLSLSCTLIRTTCIPQGFQFTGQPNVDAEGKPAGRRGHEFSLWKALAKAGHKIAADYDLHTEHRVLTEEEAMPTPPPPHRHGQENFIRTRWCTKRIVCGVCRNSQVWRDTIRQEFSVPADFDAHCPNGIKGGTRSLPEMAASAARTIGQAASAVLQGRSVLASQATQNERWRLCKACKDYYIPDEKRCRQGGCYLEIKIPLSFSVCDLGKWKAEAEGTPPTTRTGCCGQRSTQTNSTNVEN